MTTHIEPMSREPTLTQVAPAAAEDSSIRLSLSPKTLLLVVAVLAGGGGTMAGKLLGVAPENDQQSPAIVKMEAKIDAMAKSIDDIKQDVREIRNRPFTPTGRVR